MTKPATAASTPLRASVFQPAGSECSCPKQWHSGLRPRAKLALIPTTNRSSSTSAPTAPHQAVEAGIRAAATASAASGSKTPSGAAKDAGTPKSTNAFFDPARSASLVTPATMKTETSSTRATSSATSMKRPLSGRLPEPPQLGARLPYIHAKGGRDRRRHRPHRHRFYYAPSGTRSPRRLRERARGKPYSLSWVFAVVPATATAWLTATLGLAGPRTAAHQLPTTVLVALARVPLPTARGFRPTKRDHST